MTDYLSVIRVYTFNAILNFLKITSDSIFKISPAQTIPNYNLVP